ncbi:MAG: amidohydrolase [Candidatus Bathyarchaeota archaeon]|nr:amidohydrolase [Candidatus Bathyarchaeota archaeon]
MSLEPCPRVLTGGTLIDGTGRPAITDSIVVMQGDYIVAAGKKGKIEIPKGAEVYDVSGMTVVPGFIDSHCHFYHMGISMIRDVQLRDTPTLEAAVVRLKERAKATKKGDWILGKGWDESKWPENRYPTKADLDAISKTNPIMIVRICGHLLTLNTPALKIAGITGKTPQPEGGQIDVGTDGEPTGILRDCRHLVESFIPKITEETAVDGLKIASEYALSLGCTSIGDAGLGADALKAYQTALAKGYLKVRAYLFIDETVQKQSYEMGIRTGFGNDMIKIGPSKHLMDGSLGARTAALFEPYSDEPSTKGLLIMPPEVLDEKAKAAHRHGNQLAIHAIGDYAIECVINSIQAALKEKPRKDHRHRIEHCEILTAGQIERIKELGIIPAVQPNFVGEWAGPGSMYEQRLGDERNRLNNPYRILLDEGITIAFGSDGMPFHPIYGVWSAVNHGIKDARITLVEAIKCYTLNGAYASFDEDVKGSIEVGKLADVAVIDRDLTKSKPEDIRDAKVYMTIVNGKILYHKGL